MSVVIRSSGRAIDLKVVWGGGMIARVMPFGLYAIFLLISQSIRHVGDALGWDASTVELLYLWSYPVRIMAVTGALAWYWSSYEELRWPPSLSAVSIFLTVGVGLAVYMVWVRMDWPWAIQGSRSEGYNPFIVRGLGGYGLALIRLCGAAMIVPIMEEIFWRSFVMRYLISSEFQLVPIGLFKPFSFLVVVVLFGVEHDLWLAGMIAGSVYGVLLLWSRNLWACVSAHAVTNFALGIHVLVTEEWYWW